MKKSRRNFPEFAEYEKAQAELAQAEQQAREYYLERYRETAERSWYGGKVSVRIRRKAQLSPEEERRAVEWALAHNHTELLSPNERYKEALLGETLAGMPGTILDVPTVYLPTDLTKIPEVGELVGEN